MKKIVAYVLSLAMVLSLVPIAATADAKTDREFQNALELISTALAAGTEAEPSAEVQETMAEVSEEEGGPVVVTPEVIVDDEVSVSSGGAYYVDFPLEMPRNTTTKGEAKVMADSLPSAYSSVTEGRVTSVKNQHPCGTCWAFAATSSLEANILINLQQYVDLSELQLAYFMFHRKLDPLGNADGDAVSIKDISEGILNNGGNPVMATWAMAGWTNGALEETYPYADPYISDANAGTLSEEKANSEDQFHMQNTRFIPIGSSEAELNAVKQAVISEGSVLTIMYYEDRAFQYKLGAYYTAEDTKGANHAVSIVGWNDDYPAEYFFYTDAGGTHHSLGASQKGAWLCKNSWGADWGVDGDTDPAIAEGTDNKGYFWLSYYDASLCACGQAYTHDAQDAYQHNYQYDGSNGYSYISSTPGSFTVGATYQVKGLTDQYERIEAIGIGLLSTDLSYTVEIYTKSTDPSSPTDGTKVATVSGKTNYEGYYTIKIPDGPLVKKGEYYSIVVKLQKPNQEEIRVPVDYASTDSPYYTFTVNLDNDRTYFMVNGTWVDAAEESCTIRLKGYTNDETIPITDLAITGPDIVKLGHPETLKAVKKPANATEDVIWSSEDSSIAAVTQSGVVTGVTAGTTTILATSKNDSSIVAKKNIVVTPDNIREENISLYVDGQKTIRLDTGNYADTYISSLLNEKVATVHVTGKNVPGQDAIPASFSQVGNFAAGDYLIRSGSYYLVNHNGSVSATSDISGADTWTVSGSASALTIRSGSYYLTHDNSGNLSLSTASDSSWQYSNGFRFVYSRKVLFFTLSTTYYMNGSSGRFKCQSSSTSANAVIGRYVEGQPAIPASANTTIVITGIGAGTTKFLVNDVLYKVTISKKPDDSQKIVRNIRYQDNGAPAVDLNTSQSQPVTVSGFAGESYEIIPADIPGYITPDKVTGIFKKGETADIVLTYKRNPDRSALKKELDNILDEQLYTEESYQGYTIAITAGRKVYDDALALQSDVDQAVKDILKAKENLVKAVAPKTYSLDTDGPDIGSTYVLAIGEQILTVKSDNSLSTKRVGISKSNTIAASELDDSCLWILGGSSSAYTLRNKATGLYLAHEVSGNIFKVSSARLYLSSSSSTWKANVSGSTVKFYCSFWLTRIYIGTSFGMSTSAASCNLYKQLSD